MVSWTTKQTKIFTFEEEDHKTFCIERNQNNVESFIHATRSKGTKKIVTKAAPNLMNKKFKKNSKGKILM